MPVLTKKKVFGCKRVCSAVPALNKKKPGWALGAKEGEKGTPEGEAAAS